MVTSWLQRFDSILGEKTFVSQSKRYFCELSDGYFGNFSIGLSHQIVLLGSQSKSRGGVLKKAGVYASDSSANFKALTN